MQGIDWPEFIDLVNGRARFTSHSFRASYFKTIVFCLPKLERRFSQSKGSQQQCGR
jgi:hypothetical protein